MNTEQIHGNWQIFKGKIREQWGKLTDDEIEVAEGRIDQLAGSVALKYGIAKEDAHRKLESLHTECSSRK